MKQLIFLLAFSCKPGGSQPLKLLPLDCEDTSFLTSMKPLVYSFQISTADFMPLEFFVQCNVQLAAPVLLLNQKNEPVSLDGLFQANKINYYQLEYQSIPFSMVGDYQLSVSYITDTAAPIKTATMPLQICDAVVFTQKIPNFDVFFSEKAGTYRNVWNFKARSPLCGSAAPQITCLEINTKVTSCPSITWHSSGKYLFLEYTHNVKKEIVGSSYEIKIVLCADNRDTNNRDGCDQFSFVFTIKACPIEELQVKTQQQSFTYFVGGALPQIPITLTPECVTTFMFQHVYQKGQIGTSPIGGWADLVALGPSVNIALDRDDDYVIYFIKYGDFGQWILKSSVYVDEKNQKDFDITIAVLPQECSMFQQPYKTLNLGLFEVDIEQPQNQIFTTGILNLDCGLTGAIEPQREYLQLSADLKTIIFYPKLAKVTMQVLMAYEEMSLILSSKMYTFIPPNVQPFLLNYQIKEIFLKEPPPLIKSSYVGMPKQIEIDILPNFIFDFKVEIQTTKNGVTEPLIIEKYKASQLKYPSECTTACLLSLTDVGRYDFVHRIILDNNQVNPVSSPLYQSTVYVLPTDCQFLDTPSIPLTINASITLPSAEQILLTVPNANDCGITVSISPPFPSQIEMSPDLNQVIIQPLGFNQIFGVQTYTLSFRSRIHTFIPDRDIILTISFLQNCAYSKIIISNELSLVRELVYFVRSGAIYLPLPEYQSELTSCANQLTYSISCQDEDNNLIAIPTFLALDTGLRVITIQSNLFRDSGKSLRVTVQATNNFVINADYSFKLITKFMNSPPTASSILPVFIEYGKSSSWKIPEFVDPDGDLVSYVRVSLSQFNSWLSFDQNKQEFKIDGANMGKFQRKIIIPITIGDEYGAFTKLQQEINIQNGPKTNSTIIERPTNSTDIQPTSNHTESLSSIDQVDQSTPIEVTSNITKFDSQGNQQQLGNSPKPGLYMPNWQPNKKDQKKAAIPPSADIKPLNFECGINIHFSQPMNFTNLSEEMFDVEIKAYTQYRTDKNLIRYQLMSESLVRFNWTLQSSEISEIKIIVSIENPLDVSVGSTTHILSVAQKNATDLFSFYGQPLLPKIDYQLKLNPQVTQESASMVRVLTSASQTATTASLVYSSFLIFSYYATLNLLFSMTGSLQYILFLSILNINVPGNMNTVFEKLFKIMTFDLIPEKIMKPWYNFVRKTEKQNEISFEDLFNKRFYQMGYESSNPLLNLSSTIIPIFSLIGAMILVPILSWSNLIRCSSIHTRLGTLNKSLYWNQGLRLVKELYLDLLLISIIRLRTHEFNTNYETAMSIIAICSSVLLLLFPLATVLIMYQYRDQTDNEVVIQKYGTLFEEIDTKKKTSLLFTPIFLGGRILFVCVILLLQFKPYFQVTAIILIALFQAMYQVAVRPFDNVLMNRVELMNQAFSLVLSQMCLSFTGYHYSGEVFYKYGWLIIGITALLIVCNVVIQILNTWSEIKPKFKGIYLRLKKQLMKVKSKPTQPSQVSDYESSEFQSDWDSCDDEIQPNEPQLLIVPQIPVNLLDSQTERQASVPKISVNLLDSQTERQASAAVNIVENERSKLGDRLEPVPQTQRKCNTPRGQNYREVMQNFQHALSQHKNSLHVLNIEIQESKKAWSDCTSFSQELDNLIEEISQPTTPRKSSRNHSKSSHIEGSEVLKIQTIHPSVQTESFDFQGRSREEITRKQKLMTDQIVDEQLLLQIQILAHFDQDEIILPE